MLNYNIREIKININNITKKLVAPSLIKSGHAAADTKSVLFPDDYWPIASTNLFAISYTFGWYFCNSISAI